MENEFDLLQGAIGYNQKLAISHVAVPIAKPIEVKGRWQIVNSIYIVTGDFKLWPASPEEQKNRNTYLQSIPQFPIGKKYWLESDVRRFIESKGQPHIDPYLEVFGPIRDLLERHIDFHAPTDSSLLAVWIMGTYLMPIFDAYPYISLMGTRGSGKTKVLEAVSRLAFNAELTSNSTPSSIFRIIEANQSTILIDEGEMLSSREDSPELRLILNAGYRRNNPVSRTNKESHLVEFFNTYSPKMIAAINPLDPTLRSRCLQLTMVRTANKEKGNKRLNDSSTTWSVYKDALYRYALQCMREVKEIFDHDEDINILECRQNELWSPLLTIAKHLNLYTTATEFEDLKKRALDDDLEEDSLDDWHKAVLLSLDQLVTLKRAYTIREVKQKVATYIEDEEELKRMTSRWLGSALARFGLRRGKRQEEGNTYLICREEVDDLMSRYQLKDLAEHPEHAEVLTNEEVSLEEIPL